MAQNGLKWPPKAILSTLGSYSGSLHRIWDHWALYWCKKEEKLAPKWVQFGPIQELVSGVLEARGINRHNFFDYFPPLGTHTKWFMQKKSLARTTKIPRGFTHFECITVPSAITSLKDPILLNIRPNCRPNSHMKSDLYQTWDPKKSDLSKNQRFVKVVLKVFPHYI